METYREQTYSSKHS